MKYVDKNTPEMYREWLSAINESLSEQIEETNYHRPELQTVINSIAKNLVSPEDKYAMIDEYNFESDKKEKFEEGIKKGEKAKALAIAKNLLVAMNNTQIADMTGLTIEAVAELRNNAQ